MRKYHDAILYGAKLAGQNLPPGYGHHMKGFLQTMKKQKAGAKTAGHLQEQDADEIPWVLFFSICEWALGVGNIMVWCFTIIQWNVMGCSVNVDPLGFYSLS